MMNTNRVKKLLLALIISLFIAVAGAVSLSPVLATLVVEQDYTCLTRDLLAMPGAGGDSVS